MPVLTAMWVGLVRAALGAPGAGRGLVGGLHATGGFLLTLIAPVAFGNGGTALLVVTVALALHVVAVVIAHLLGLRGERRAESTAGHGG